MPGTSTPVTVGVRFSSPVLRSDKIIPLTHDELDFNFKINYAFNQKNSFVDLSDFQNILSENSLVTFTLFNFDLNLVKYRLSMNEICKYTAFCKLNVLDSLSNPLEIFVPISINIDAVTDVDISITPTFDFATSFPLIFSASASINNGLGYVDISFDHANIFRAIISNNDFSQNWIIPCVDTVSLNV